MLSVINDSSIDVLLNGELLLDEKLSGLDILKGDAEYCLGIFSCDICLLIATGETEFSGY